MTIYYGQNLICGVHNWDYRVDSGVSEYHNEEALQKFNAWISLDDDAVYVDEAEVGPVEPQFRFQVQGAEGAWGVEVLRGEGQTGTFYARTSFNRSLVELTGSVAQNILSDLPDVLPEE